MNDAREAFRRWTDCLLDPTRSPLEHRDAAQAWCDWGLKVLGIDENVIPGKEEAFFADTVLATGKAISPLGAARCVREHRRTAVFLQAMDTAIRAALERFSSERIHVLEAGCGPLAPLALPFALRYPPDRVGFTLLDLHPIALQAAQTIVKALALEASIRDFAAADATVVQFADDDRPHVIACEVLLRALTREPQVAATLNLASQLQPRGVFVPERIDVDAVLFDAGRWQSPASVDVGSGSAAIVNLGTVFSPGATAVPQLQFLMPPRAAPDGTKWLRAKAISAPIHDRERAPIRLFTRIQAFGEHRLGDFESSLNLPERVEYPSELAVHGGQLDFGYECSRDPGLRVIGATINGPSHRGHRGDGG